MLEYPPLSLGVTLPCLDRSSVLLLVLFWLLPNTEFCLILSNPGLLFLRTVSSIERAVWPNEAGCTLLYLCPPYCCPLSKVAGQPPFLCLLPALTKSCPFPPAVLFCSCAQLTARHSCQLWEFSSCLPVWLRTLPPDPSVLRGIVTSEGQVLSCASASVEMIT